MTGLCIRTVIILSYMAFSPFDPQICPKSKLNKTQRLKSRLQEQNPPTRVEIRS
jgi:hypothetical protein